VIRGEETNSHPRFCFPTDEDGDDEDGRMKTEAKTPETAAEGMPVVNMVLKWQKLSR
jgi:hypothetical protein